MDKEQTLKLGRTTNIAMMNELEFEGKAVIDMRQVNGIRKLLPPISLRKMYQDTSERLGRANPQSSIRTEYELRMARFISHHTRLRVMSSFWIGRSCFDLFIPSVAGQFMLGQKRMRGLVIELNGPIHDRESKMAKDEFRLEMLKELGIGVWTIENPDINHPKTRQTLQSLSGFPRLDYRGRKKLMGQIYAWTLIANKVVKLGEG